MKGLLGVAVLAASLAAAGSPRASGPPSLIVFASTRGGATGVYSVRPDGTRLTRLVADGQDPRASPDGRHVAFTTSNYAYTVLDVATGARSRLKGQIGLGWAFTARPWSSDGRRLAVGADDGVHVYKADGTPADVVDASDAGEPSWSPDGTQLAYSGFDTGVWVVRADGSGTERQLVANGEYPLWSPDGRDIAFDRYVDSDVVTFVVPAAGGTPRRIGKGYPAWSPDSATLALAAGDGLSLYTRDGSLQRTLLRGKTVDSAVWSPDGKTVLAAIDGDLWLFARDGSSRRQLTQGRRNGYENSDPSWVAGTVAPAGSHVPVGTTGRMSLAAVSRATGALVTRFPTVTGRSPEATSAGPTVFALASDGRGGWYIGGDFGFVGGVACPNLAHVDNAFRVDRRWCPKPDAAVRALLRIGQTLYVGGEMRHIGGAARSALAAFSVQAGRLTRWSPRVGGDVLDVLGLAADPSGRRIYIGGDFTRVDGAARMDLAAVDAVTGAATAFAPNPDRTFHGDGLVAFAVTPARVYATGYYPHIGGESAGQGLSALDPATGKLLARKPACLCIASSLAAVGDRVFVAGFGDRLGGVRRDDLASFRGSTGAVDGWAPTHVGAAAVVAPAGAAIFAAIGGTQEGGAHRLAAYDSATARRIWLSPSVFDGGIEAVAADNRVVVVGGGFRNVR